MTPTILQPMFEQWRKEGLSFYASSENYNKTDALGGGVMLFNYPNHSLLDTSGYWEESNNWEGTPPAFLSKDMVERIALYLIACGKPRTINLQVTTKCNYACPMCFFFGKGYKGKQGAYFKDNPSLKPKNMPLDETKAYVDKIADYGAKMVSFSPGAEFFVYPYWEEISRYAKSKGLKVSAMSNGSLVTEEVVAKLKDMGFDEIMFSIDSIRKDTYAKVRSPREKDYQTAISAPILAVQAGIYTRVHFVQQEPNLGEKEEVFSFYRKHNINYISSNIQSYVNTDGNKNAIATEENQYHYIHGLCGDYNTISILMDGNIVPCCGLSGFYEKIKAKLDDFSLREHSLEEVLAYQHSLFQKKDKDIMDLCYNCSNYQVMTKVERKTIIQEKYFMSDDGMTETHFKIPEKLKTCPDDILLWLYQHNIITKMKADKIL